MAWAENHPRNEVAKGNIGGTRNRPTRTISGEFAGNRGTYQVDQRRTNDPSSRCQQWCCCFARIRQWAARQQRLPHFLTGDGKEQNLPIRDRFEENTRVTVELLSTDENYYNYFFQLSSIAGNGPNSTTPYNPTGNFDHEVLGYFGIYSASVLSIEL